MARVAVDKMTLKQIEALEEQISAAKAKVATAAKADLKAKIDALLDASGFTLADLYPHVGRRGKSKSVAKYANPADASQTWTVVVVARRGFWQPSKREPSWRAWRSEAKRRMKLRVSSAPGAVGLQRGREDLLLMPGSPAG